MHMFQDGFFTAIHWARKILHEALCFEAVGQNAFFFEILKT